MKAFALAVLATLVLFPKAAAAGAGDGDQSFLLCDGMSKKDRSDAFSFTVTLNASKHKVISIGSGDGATTENFTDAEIVGKQEFGGGVSNRLTIDRASQTFSLTITHNSSAPGAEGETVPDDEFNGKCVETGKAF